MLVADFKTESSRDTNAWSEHLGIYYDVSQIYSVLNLKYTHANPMFMFTLDISPNKIQRKPQLQGRARLDIV